MACIPFSRLPRTHAQMLLENQKLYSEGQKQFAQSSPHLVWVNPPNRTLPAALRMEVYERDQGICAYCDKELAEDEFTIDHIEPVAAGGGNDPDNLTVACRPCNSSKGSRLFGVEDA